MTELCEHDWFTPQEGHPLCGTRVLANNSPRGLSGVEVREVCRKCNDTRWRPARASKMPDPLGYLKP